MNKPCSVISLYTVKQTMIQIKVYKSISSITYNLSYQNNNLFDVEINNKVQSCHASVKAKEANKTNHASNGNIGNDADTVKIMQINTANFYK